MNDFAGWLEGLKKQDPDPTPLKNFAHAHPAEWPSWSNELGQYQQVIRSINPPPPDREDLLILLSTYHERWKVEQQPKPKPSGLWGICLNVLQQCFNHLGSIALLVFGLAVAYFLLYGIKDPAFFASLAKVDQARGLITFLFALSTTGVIILIAIAIFWVPKEEVDARYAKAKDLLTVVIGVLGTILGFYFGLQTSDANHVAIANVATSVSTAKPGDKVDISGRILGGTAPYRYTITFSDPTGAIKAGELNTPEQKTDTGGFFAPITIPTMPKGAKPTGLLFVIMARDSNGTQTQTTGMLPVEAPSNATASGPAETKQPPAATDTPTGNGQPPNPATTAPQKK